jgi:hypothetical protein
MRSHFSLNQGIAAACAVAGAATTLNSNCSAQAFIAADYATNSAYASGWQAGQNGGYGFGAWSMSGTETTSPIEADIDRTSPYDPFGVAWVLYNPEGTQPGPGSPGTFCTNPPLGTDISRAGRALPNSGLRPGDTFSTVIANPTCRAFYRGYTIVLSTGSDNIQYGGAGAQASVGTFEYFTYGKWYASDGSKSVNTTLFDTDTATNGVRIDITLTSLTTYHVVMTPLDNPGLAYSADATLQNKGLTDQGAVNWVTYQFYNTDSDFYPTLADCGPDRTDFYIKSMTVGGQTLDIQKAGSDVLLSWATNVPAFNLESTTNLVAPVWNPVLPLPSVVNGQNVVTNPIVGAQQYYRLHYQP